MVYLVEQYKIAIYVLLRYADMGHGMLVQTYMHSSILESFINDRITIFPHVSHLICYPLTITP